MHNKLKTLLIIILFNSPVSFSGESGLDNQLAQSYKYAVIFPVLFSNIDCINHSSTCNKDNGAFYYSVGDGFSWKFYGIQDKKIINTMLINTVNHSEKVHKDKKIRVYFYKEKKEDVGIFTKPIAQLIMGGGDK